MKHVARNGFDSTQNPVKLAQIYNLGKLFLGYLNPGWSDVIAKLVLYFASDAQVKSPVLSRNCEQFFIVSQVAILKSVFTLVEKGWEHRVIF